MDLIKDFELKKRDTKTNLRLQLRKRSKDSIVRPKAKKNLFSNDPR